MLTVHILGAVEVRRDGQPLELGGPLQRAVVAHLALEAGRVVSVEKLIDRLWGDEPPRTPLGTLQSYVSRLRRQVETPRAAGASPEVLVSEAPGYVLRIPTEQIDVHRFRSLVAQARTAAAAGDHAVAVTHFDEALSLWRGPALGGAGPDDGIRPIIVQLEEERDAAREDRFDSLLALGRHAEIVPRLQSAVREHPLRERLWGQLALALYRDSRQADALRTLSDARDLLLDQLGLDPGPALRDLEQRILAQDPSLLGTERQVPPRSAVSPAATSELVGRDHEWQTLAAALDAAASGAPQFVLVAGEPGMGKSTLCDTLLASASSMGWSTAIGRCIEPGLAPSLWPFIELARCVVAVPHEAPSDAESTNPWRQLAIGRHDAHGSLSLVELADRFVSLLDQVGSGSWLIVLDDLHWADQGSLDLLRLTLERIGGRNLLVVGAHRPPEIVPGSLLGDALGGLHRAASSTHRLRLTPLCTADVARLVELTAGTTPTTEVAQLVQTRAGGNPLFVSELARLAGERGLTDHSVVPDAIRDVVRDRLAGLPERSIAELEVVAVLGERFDLRAAMAASERDPDDCLDALDAAIVTRILVPERDGFRFSHALVRDAVLAEVSALRRARLHHRAAEAIVATRGEGPDEAEPIAHHRLASAAFADPLVVARAAVRASDVARWRGALDSADSFAERALDVLASVPRTAESSPVEADALEALVAAAFRRVDDAAVERVTARVTEFAERTGSHPALALSLFLTWGDVDGTDDLGTLAAGNEQATALAARTTDRYATVITRFMLASAAFLEGRLDEAAAHADAAIDASGAIEPDARPEQVPLVLLPVVAALIAAVRDERQQAIDHAYRRAAAWMAKRSEVDPTADVALAFNRALVHALLDEPQQVYDGLHALPIVDDHGFVANQSLTCDVLLGWARVRLGDADGLAQAGIAMEQLDRSNERIIHGALRTLVADACLALDDPAAVPALQRARVDSERRGEIWWLAETIRLQAMADRRFGDGSRATTLLAESATLAERQGARLVARRLALSDPKLPDPKLPGPMLPGPKLKDDP